MAATRLIALHVNKGKSVEQCLADRTEYAKNDLKTENGELVSAYACDVKTADEEFMLSKREYEQITGRHQKGDVIAYQIRQSFKPGEITPEEANQVGYETAMRFTKGKHAFIVATHTDRAHIHNHIVYNSTTLDCTHKFRDFFFSAIALQRVSDLVCLEHGLSVIKPRKPSEREKRTTYPKRRKYRDFICEDIDKVLAREPKDYEEFLRMLQEEDYEIKRGKNTAIRGKAQKRFIRFNSLEEGYREEDIKKILLGEMEHAKESDVKGCEPKREFDMLLDIQDIIAKGKGAGYERWAKLYNIKQLSKALLFLQEHDCRDYEELAKRASDAADRFAEISKGIKDAEARMAEIAVLKTHIKNYARTKDVYVMYKKTGFSKKFFEAHREELTLHKAARDAFSKYKGKKLPTMKELSAEYGELIAKKKALYAEYGKAKEEMRSYQTAKYDIDRILNMDDEEQHKKEQRQKKRETSL